MPPKPNRLGHLRTEIVETRDVLFRRRWWWRTVTIQNGEIGVRSETYNSMEAVERSIRQHRTYFGYAPVFLIDIEGERRELTEWTR